MFTFSQVLNSYYSNILDQEIDIFASLYKDCHRLFSQFIVAMLIEDCEEQKFYIETAVEIFSQKLTIKTEVGVLAEKI